MHNTLKNWTVKRSGPALVVKGQDAETGLSVKLTGIVEVAGRGDDNTVAIDGSGVEHLLLT